MQTRFSSKFSRAALVASLAIGSALAFAQPAPGAMDGVRAHKMHAGQGEAHFAQRMEMLKSKLNLNATQEAQFNTAREATKAAMEAGRSARVNARTMAQAELQKADPDLANLLLQRESVKEANAVQRKAALNEWAKFLGLLTTEQKSIVKSQLINRTQRMGGV
ncbi:MAG: Spy/CpxP family protein refolding chaperone [Casimicrobium sp.]